MAYVYEHYKANTGEMFYVGISNISDGKYSRATDTNKRSKFWKSIILKHGFYHKIVADNITWEKAIKLEIKLIAKHGRIHNKTGNLCNLTVGGEGCKGFPITEQYRENCRKAQAKRLKPDLSGENNPFFGKNHTKESMIKKSKTTIANGKLKGEKNPNFGKPVSEERREHQRQFRLGKTHPEETKIKIRAWGKGRPKPIEWRESRTGLGNQNFIDFASLDIIVKMYVEDGMSTIQIGKHFNVSHATVYKRLVQGNVEIRGQGKRRVAIVCINDGLEFQSNYAAAKYYSISQSGIYQVLKGNYKQIKGLNFKLKDGN